MYYLYHIRKTGGRSIIRSFFSLATNNVDKLYKQLSESNDHLLKCGDKKFVGWDTSKISSTNFFFAFSHDTACSFKLPKQVRTITCFRDPINRLKSYYNHLMEIKQSTIKDSGCVHAKLPDLKWAHDNQIKFIKCAPKKHLLNQLFMFSKAMKTKEAINNISKVDYVLQLEHMENGISRLSDSIGLNLKHFHAGATTIKQEFSQDFITEAKRVLKPEFELIDRLKDLGLLK